jgi:hypothetical protein
MKRLYWLATWCRVFSANLWRVNGYYCPEGRISVWFASEIAKTVADISANYRYREA